MANKDYQNLSTQASGSITKMTPFQIKSNDGFGSLAIDLEAFRGQFAAVIGDGYKTDLSNTTGSSGNNIANVSLKNLANYLNATPANNELRVLSKLSGSGDLALAGNATIQGNLIITGSTTFSSALTTTGNISGSGDLYVQGNSRLQGTLWVTGSSAFNGASSFNGNVTLGDSTADVVNVNSQISGSLFNISGGSIYNTPIGASGQSSGQFTTISGSGNLSVQGNSALQGTLQVTGSTTFGSTLAVNGTSTLTGNVTLGGDIVSSGAGARNIFSGAGANTITIGGGSSTVSIPGTGSIGALTVSNALTVNGDLTVNGTTTTINSTTLTVDDKNVILSAILNATDGLADGGGITLSGSTDHTITYKSASASWEFSENVIPSAAYAKNLGTAGARWLTLNVATGSFSNGANTITIDPASNKIFGSALLNISASSGDLLFEDKWRGGTLLAGSTAGIKLSTSAGEWTSFNTNFSTQNSILGALNQVAANTSNPRKLTYNISASYASGTSVPVNLGSFGAGTTFDATALNDKNALVFYNGQLLGSGSTANVQANPATADYSVDAGLNNFRFGFPVSNGDVVVVKLD